MSARTNPAEDTAEILVAEDSPTQAERLRGVLENQGYRVTLAGDGRQALAFLGERQPALVISDINMPEMNGYELCTRIKGDVRFRDIPVILLTSLADVEDVLEGLACGANSFITKPYSEEYLISHIERTLAGRALRQSDRATVEVEISLAGTSHVISADPQQMLSLLISTYDAAVHRNAELVQTQDELSLLNEHLEDLVELRTAALSTEISEHKRAEERLAAHAARLEQNNRILQEFAQVAAHDLQEPLRKVQTFSDRLVTKYGDVLDETGLDYLNRMRDSSQWMQILVNDLLGFLRVSTRVQPFTQVDLNAAARLALSDLAGGIEDTKARIEISELPTIQADPTQMQQLLQNLIGNALKFHHDKRPPFIKVSAKNEGDACQIYVEDNGIGFDMQYLDRIFKPFQRLHRRGEFNGSGMGLAICRRIVERHGGDITGTSVPGEGSTFIVTLINQQPQWDKSI